MKNADMPAMPQSATDEGYGCNYIENFNGQVPTGLTKREMFAMHAMQGLLACAMESDCTIPELCADAVIAADSLLFELDREQ